MNLQTAAVTVAHLALFKAHFFTLSEAFIPRLAQVPIVLDLLADGRGSRTQTGR